MGILSTKYKSLTTYLSHVNNIRYYDNVIHVTQSGISPRVGKIAYELLQCSKYTIMLGNYVVKMEG